MAIARDAKKDKTCYVVGCEGTTHPPPSCA